jgi:hypothetical protein
MSIPYKFRFRLDQSMVFIAISALFMAATISSSHGNHIYLILPSVLAGCAGLGVLVYNLKLSGWMKVVIVGYFGPTLLGIAEGLVIMFLPTFFAGTLLPTAYLTTVNLIVQGICSLFFVVGLAMTFRDIRRKLAICEDAP